MILLSGNKKIMKRYFYIFVILLSFFAQNVFAANPRPTVVRVVGLLPDTPVLGTNCTYRAWLDDNKDEMIVNGNGADGKPILGAMFTEIEGSPGEYRIMFSLSGFVTNWVQEKNYLNIEVIYNGRTSVAWRELIPKNSTISTGYWNDESKYITFPELKLNISESSLTLCQGATSGNTLTPTMSDGSSVSSTTWKQENGDAIPGIVVNNGIANFSGVTTAKTYSVVAECNGVQSDPVSVTVKTKPAKPTLTSDKTSVCSREQIKLSASSTTPNVSYAWQFPTGVGNAAEITYEPTGPANYSVKAVLDKCESDASNTVRVEIKPNIQLQGGVTTTCETGTFKAVFSVNNGTAPFEVASDAGFNNLITSGISWSGTTATLTGLSFGSHTYYVRGAAGSCGSVSVTAAKNDADCGCGASFRLEMTDGTSSKPGEDLMPIYIIAKYNAPFVKHSFKLKKPDGSVESQDMITEKRFKFVPEVPGTYELIEYKAYTADESYSCGVSNGDTKATPIVTADELVVTAKGSAGCPSATLTAEATVSGGTAPYTYKWTTGALNVSGTNKVTVTNGSTAASGNYDFEVVVTDAAGVSKTARTQVTIYPNASATVTDIRCDAAGENFDVVITAQGTAPYKILRNGAEVPGATWMGNVVTISNLSSAGQPYTYTVQDANKCKDATVNVVANCDCSARLEMKLGDEVACGRPGETKKLILDASGGTSYSFKLLNKDAEPLFVVNGETQNHWEVEVDYEDAGECRIVDFKGVTTASPDGCDGTVIPSRIDVKFIPVPYVTAGENIVACGDDPITLKANGDSGLTFTWDNGVEDGVPFNPPVGVPTTYTVRGTNAEGCWNEASVEVTVDEKPMVTAMATPPLAICKGEAVTLVSGGTADTYTWDNGGVEGEGNMPETTTRYTVTGTMDATGCSDTASVLVVVNMPAEITEAPKDRAIAIGKNVNFTVKAIGNNLTYQWQWYHADSDTWTTFTDNTTSYPKVSGATTEELVLEEVPESWDGRKVKCIVQGDCGAPAEAEANLSVKECFDILGDIAMGEGIIPETGENTEVDGWYCKGNRIAVKALIELADPEYGEVAFSHYTWTIDGLPADKVIESDSSILSWIPEYYEDDIVVKVGVYCDGACEPVYSRPLRLKARTPDDVKLKIVTSIDPETSFCPGDTIVFAAALENDKPGSEVHWYRDIFDRGRGLTKEFVMDQKDTWVRAVFEPAADMCVEHEVGDSIFLSVKPYVQPTLSIDNNIHDTIACRGDSLIFRAYWEHAGDRPTLVWQQDIWERGYGEYATIHLNDKDTWVKCELKPGNDVCYAGERIIDTMVVRVIEPGTLTIECDMTDKHFGDELVFVSTVGGNVGEHWNYNWFVNNGMLLDRTEPEYSSSDLKQGDVVQASIVGDQICVNRIWSNEITVNYKNYLTRDTMVTIYVGEKITNLNMFKEGDTGRYFIISEYPRNGQASMNPQTGEFSYTPNRDFVGVDLVTYRVQKPGDKTDFEEGTIFITVESGGLLDIPNIITPNGDGVNDVWNLRKITEKYSEYVITVYSRSGRVVWQVRNDYDNQFDGQGGGNGTYFVPSLPSGIYTYVIDLNRGERKLISWLEIRTTFNRGYYR